ncbi:HlyD family secretion protein [Sediminimonas sp.]|uniref:HlyD family efflux transporter periplasmic adaptor subunit n=1 Tax=Sediminimonas sp. TaxID=2823379 RepID=UPI0025E7BDA1|nr:HlyD family secretion protein [Sediminimonas sp.]
MTAAAGHALREVSDKCRIGHTPMRDRNIDAGLSELRAARRQNRPLIIRARIAPTDIDRVFPGQRVLLRFTALDRRNTPELVGRVSQISADTFEDERTGRAYYRARIVMAQGEQAKLPDGAVLIPGMPVETFIRTADRTPLAYLVKPLADYFSRAFRE